MVTITNQWNSETAPRGEGLDALVYRSRLLGSDRTLVNIYGGNTSTKAAGVDHLGKPCRVLWVKGSGSDIASITAGGFAGLKQDEIEPLFDRPEMSDEEMIAYLDMTTYERGRPRQSIETLLHAFVPATHVDHTHPDAIIAIACTPRGKEIMAEIYGERAAWVDYIRPGFTLSQQIGAAVRDNPQLECVVMGKHGLVTWGETSHECYENTLRIIGEAQAYLNALEPLDTEASIVEPVGDREGLLSRVLPTLRGALAKYGPAVFQIDSSAEVLDFVNSGHAKELSQVGAACPDHLVHTKMLPMFVEWNPSSGEEALKAELLSKAEAFATAYSAYFEANKVEAQTMFAPTPRVILIPGVGMISVGADAQAADVANQLYHRAIVTMRNAATMGGFVSLSAAESFGVEYWPLELYKLSLKPAPKELAGKVAFVTGAASGIGRAIARKLVSEGAHVAIVDRNLDGAKEVADDLVARFGHRRAVAVHVDVTSENLVEEAFIATVFEYGGVDIVVNNAGIASSAPIEETSLETWNLNQGILSTGYFLVARTAFRLFKQQAVGGNLVFICSKNSVAAGKNAVAYSAAKAAELHMARCLAEEGGAFGIRVNSVMPDGVLSGSGIWDGTWRAERAATYGLQPDQLEEHYRSRTTLKVNILPEDIAEATYFFTSSASSKTTGGVLTVDGGVPSAYVR
ncbi:MAG: bifunctional rhamnulose-1-phosphate aldolase/short-chain dehydrogenase [Armatimonadetes bacterium Cent15-Ar3]|nr:MAG: bifunctional rhamnulose-1-phosphate aldolase/short-chain dehydrogenase [Armatimonadetes bacterium Cent15-Ar3]